MDIETAKSCIAHLKESNARDEMGASWRDRMISFLTALLPILEAADDGAKRGSFDGLMDVEELIRRANAPNTDHFGYLWDGIREYLALVPGLTKDANGQIVVSGSVSMDSIREHHGYVAMQTARAQAV